MVALGKAVVADKVEEQVEKDKENRMAKDSIDKAAGAGVTITIKGKDYVIKPYVVGDYIALRSYIQSNRIKAFRNASDGMEAIEKAKIIVELSSQIISESELMQESITPGGMIFMLWRVLSKTDSNIKLDDMDELLEGEEFNDLFAISEGLNKADNEKGSDPTKTNQEEN